MTAVILAACGGDEDSPVSIPDGAFRYRVDGDGTVAGRWVMPAARSLPRAASGALLSLDPLTSGFAELETDAAACAGE